MGWPCARPPAARPLPGERLLAAREHARVHRRLAGRLLAGRRRRVGHDRRAHPLQRALPVRLHARARRCVRARPRARRVTARRRGRGCGVRVCALAARARHPPQRALDRRRPARALSAPSRLPAKRLASLARRVARRGVAAEPRLQHRSSPGLPLVRLDGGRRGRAVHAQAAAAEPAGSRCGVGGRARLSRCRRLARAAVPRRRGPVSRIDPVDVRGRDVLAAAAELPGRARGERALGPDHRADPRVREAADRADALPRV